MLFWKCSHDREGGRRWFHMLVDFPTEIGDGSKIYELGYSLAFPYPLGCRFGGCVVGHSRWNLACGSRGRVRASAAPLWGESVGFSQHPTGPVFNGSDVAGVAVQILRLAMEGCHVQGVHYQQAICTTLILRQPCLRKLSAHSPSHGAPFPVIRFKGHILHQAPQYVVRWARAESVVWSGGDSWSRLRCRGS